MLRRKPKCLSKSASTFLGKFSLSLARSRAKCMAASCHVSAVLLIMVPPFPAEEAASVPQNDRFAAQFPPDFSMMALLYTVYTKNSIVSPEVLVKASLASDSSVADKNVLLGSFLTFFAYDMTKKIAIAKVTIHNKAPITMNTP